MHRQFSMSRLRQPRIRPTVKSLVGRLLVATAVAASISFAPAAFSGTVSHIPIASADLGPCPWPSGNGGRELSAYSTSINGQLPGTLVTCGQTIYDPGKGQYQNLRWTVWVQTYKNPDYCNSPYNGTVTLYLTTQNPTGGTGPDTVAICHLNGTAAVEGATSMTAVSHVQGNFNGGFIDWHTSPYL